MSKNVFMVCGLGFGDEGKGSVVDYLVRKYGLKTVVRFNGSSNAAHNVVANGVHHTFSQFGSGTLVPGVKTYLSKNVLFDPASIYQEAETLKKIGVSDALNRLVVHPECYIINPYHRAVCRFKEERRGGGRHGSTGVGLNEAETEREEDCGLLVEELLDPQRTAKVLKKSRERAIEIMGIDADYILPRIDFTASFMCGFVKEFLVAEMPEKDLTQDVVYEGAQGALLDEFYGFFPYVTRSCTTLSNAWWMMDSPVFESARKIGVMRSYTTRHGAGPFPTELPYHDQEEHNSDHPYQGTFRAGLLDLVLMKYGLDASMASEIALTHVDRLPPRVCVSYDNFDLKYSVAQSGETLTDKLQTAKPLYVNFPEDEKSIIHNIERTLECPIKIISRGKEACHKEERL